MDWMDGWILLRSLVQLEHLAVLIIKIFRPGLCQGVFGQPGMFASFSNWCMYDVNGKATRENLGLHGFAFE